MSGCSPKEADVVAVATRAGRWSDEAHARRRAGPRLAGFLTFLDPPKPDAGEALAALQRLGVEVKVITGDNDIVAKKVCRTSA